MTEAVEQGASLAWRLLATLEGGSLIVATSALIAYTARLKLFRRRHNRFINSVLVTNTRNTLGEELKRQLEAHGCTVDTLAKETTNVSDTNKVDSLVVIGAESKANLDGISRLVSEDVYENLNLLESLAARVRRGGTIAWACAGDTGGAYGSAAAAFDDVILASLRHVAKVSHCEAVWVGRCENDEQAVEKILADLIPNSTQNDPYFALRNAAHKVSEFLGRRLKMIT